MTHADTRLLSPVRLERLASAFEIRETDVLADAAIIANWSDAATDLEAALNVRHAWHSDEAFHFIRWVRLEMRRTQRELPDGVVGVRLAG